MTILNPTVPVEGQCFVSLDDWVARGTRQLTSHEAYCNTEHPTELGSTGWRGEHFTALCFDQQGRRCRNGADFQRARDEDAFPVWWVWPDQLPALIARGDVR